MVLTRYESGKNVASAHACGRTVQGAYKALNVFVRYCLIAFLLN